MKRQLSISCLGLFGLSLWAVPAAADVAARYEVPNDSNRAFDMEMTLEVDENGNLRVQMSGQATYAVVLDGISYFVSRDGDGFAVMRAEDIATVLGEVSTRMGISEALKNRPVDADTPRPALKSLGQREINDRKGTAYGAPSDGKAPQFVEFVISDDPKLAPLGQAFAKSFEHSSSMFGRMVPGLSGLVGAFGPEMDVLKKGAPLSLMSMELTDVSLDKIDPNRFQLPAPPLTIDQIRLQYEGLPSPPTLPPRKKG